MILLHDDIRVYMCCNKLNWRTGTLQVRQLGDAPSRALADLAQRLAVPVDAVSE